MNQLDKFIGSVHFDLVKWIDGDESVVSGSYLHEVEHVGEEFHNAVIGDDNDGKGNEGHVYIAPGAEEQPCLVLFFKGLRQASMIF